MIDLQAPDFNSRFKTKVISEYWLKQITNKLKCKSFSSLFIPPLTQLTRSKQWQLSYCALWSVQLFIFPRLHWCWPSFIFAFRFSFLLSLSTRSNTCLFKYELKWIDQLFRFIWFCCCCFYSVNTHPIHGNNIFFKRSTTALIIYRIGSIWIDTVDNGYNYWYCIQYLNETNSCFTFHTDYYHHSGWFNINVDKQWHEFESLVA